MEQNTETTVCTTRTFSTPFKIVLTLVIVGALGGAMYVYNVSRSGETNVAQTKVPAKITTQPVSTPSATKP